MIRCISGLHHHPVYITMFRNGTVTSRDPSTLSDINWNEGSFPFIPSHLRPSNAPPKEPQIALWLKTCSCSSAKSGSASELRLRDLLASAQQLTNVTGLFSPLSDSEEGALTGLWMQNKTKKVAQRFSAGFHIHVVLIESFKKSSMHWGAREQSVAECCQKSCFLRMKTASLLSVFRR